MSYPTMEAVEKADHLTLAKWFRFLPSPGMDAIGRPDFDEILGREAPIMDRIFERFKEAGGMTSGISKTVGW